MLRIDRRKFVVLLASFTAAAAPAIAARGRVERFVIKPAGVKPGTEVWAVAEGDTWPSFYNVRALVTAVERVAEDCYVWAVEYEPGHDVIWFTESVAGHIETVASSIPERVIAVAALRAREDDMYWRREIIEEKGRA